MGFGLGIRRRLERALFSMGFEIVNLGRPASRTIGGDAPVLAAFVEALLAKGDVVRLVQIGANDGETADPLNSVLALPNVEAILIEPLPHLCKILRAKYADKPKVQIVEVAISDRHGALPFFVVRRSEDNEIVDSRISSFDRGHVEDHITRRKALEPELFGVSPHIEEIQVPTSTLMGVFQSAGWERADILAIDAEGHDALIVENVLEYGPICDIIYFEHSNLRELQLRRLSGDLVESGYSLAHMRGDTIAIRDTSIA